MWNAKLDDAQAGIKISGRNIKNLRYANGLSFMAESEEQLRCLLNVICISEVIDISPCIMAVPIYIPTKSVEGFPFLHTLCSIYCS